MRIFEFQTRGIRLLFGWLGSICWLLIIPSKLIRFFNPRLVHNIIDLLPSFFGSAGLFFVVLSSSSKLSRLTIFQATILVGFIALVVEFAQLLPRPGILERLRYTFDWLDVAGSLLGIAIARLTTWVIIRK